MHKKACGALIRQIHCAMQKNANNELRAEDLTFAQVHLLFVLRDQPGGCCALKALEKRMGIAQSTTVGIVKRSGEKGFVEIFGDSADRRAKSVRITEKGLEVCSDTEAKIRNSEARLLKDLTAEEQETLLSLLTRVYGSISAPAE